MFLLGASFVYGLALGAISAVLLVMAASLTLLPAMLGFAGAAIDRLRMPGLPPAGRPSSTRTASGTAGAGSSSGARGPLAAIALVILVVMALPVFSLHLLFTDAGNDPTVAHHPPGLRPARPTASGPAPTGRSSSPSTSRRARRPAVLDDLRRGHQPDARTWPFAVPPQLNQAGDAATIVVIPDSSPQNAETEQLVHHAAQTT